MRDAHHDLSSILARATTVDELLSDNYRMIARGRGDIELADRRLAAWCRAAANGDWALFDRRLERDGWSRGAVADRFRIEGTFADPPQWTRDAGWIWKALCEDPDRGAAMAHAPAEVPFEDLLSPATAAACRRLRDAAPVRAGEWLAERALTDLDRALTAALADLLAPALYERLVAARADGLGYREFAAATRATGWRDLFRAKPVLLRLSAGLLRQWIDAGADLLNRLDADLPAIRLHFPGLRTSDRLVGIHTQLSDPHHRGRTVAVLEFGSGARIVYKPKDLRVDAAWARLVEGLNARAPVDLRAARVLVREGYGWSEFIDAEPSSASEDFPLFFRRAGAWLALFHAFVAVDMHQENIMAAGAHPVPVDLETILQHADTRFHDPDDGPGAAFRLAMQQVVDSVMTVGLLPAYGKESPGKAFLIGGVTSNAAPRVTVGWADVGTDTMRPVTLRDTVTVTTNVPHDGAERARLGDHIDDLIDGFAEYAVFLRRCSPEELHRGFRGLRVRTVIRPTRYYYMLLERLRNHRAMDDGPCWSAQADFTARLADWEADTDPGWPVQRAERGALLELNIPHFTTAADGHDLCEGQDLSVVVEGPSGMARSRERLRNLDDAQIAAQVELIRQNTALLRPDPVRVRSLLPAAEVGGDEFLCAADNLARDVRARAISGGGGAAWIGMDWLDDSAMSQLVVLGPDLYNGNCGLAVFLGAHAAVTGDPVSREFAISAVARLRETLRGRNPARVVRTLGIGGALGVGSIVYGLAVLAESLGDQALLDDARFAAGLITEDVIAADVQLDLLAGAAGAILGLLRLHRQSGSAEVLATAEACGRHLLRSRRVGAAGARMWPSTHFGRPLNGMAHGASGFAYALTALAAATDNGAYSDASDECLAFERSTFSAVRQDWSDLRDVRNPGAPCKWCYGAPGIGLARLAMTSIVGLPAHRYVSDIDAALSADEKAWPAPTDTLCCGTMAGIELLTEAGDVLCRDDLAQLATDRPRAVVHTAHATGDYRWSSGDGRFNLGLFRGIAGVGYTLLRKVDPSLPNVLIWE
ncbi:type 2 lanthipeptide synthetase LanM family protein [Mycolicibacterium sp. BiH015]|uniref:type 2 lanthipeptide synthetase LanM family protein n=1 Tax=Mycolicibacterium sp. BiH015 TaxID=3018808 RepID=UPI0022E441AE|nr:type 2 lanthipeptide synthetase LanM family protein [Mycolicibacterium sp. BiH015]MDA2892495.1 type 2 lanthipeptide synthetase LanM family protein [Mycolicibacterium sp. BiH015]